MKGFFAALTILVIFNSCSEKNVSLADSNTFTRYFNDGNQNNAMDVIKTSDKGYLILYNSVVSTASTFGLIKTNAYGNVQWKYQSVLKDTITANNIAVSQDAKGNDLWYTIVGGTTHLGHLYVERVDVTGIKKDHTVFKAVNSTGVGVAQRTDSSSVFYVIGTCNSGCGASNFILTKIDGTSGTLVSKWSQFYGQATNALSRRLFLNASETELFTTATLKTSSVQSSMQFFDFPFNKPSSLNATPFPNGNAFSLSGNDINRLSFGYVMVGGRQVGGNNTDALDYNRIVCARVDGSGNLIDSLNNYKLPQKQTQSPANSVTTTIDGGLLILGTISDANNTNTDYYLIKTDFTGNSVKSLNPAGKAPCNACWTRVYGGKYNDVGVRVLQANDGGYIILGTTTLANVNTVLLMKTDTQGNIE